MSVYVYAVSDCFILYRYTYIHTHTYIYIYIHTDTHISTCMYISQGFTDVGLQVRTVGTGC